MHIIVYLPLLTSALLAITGPPVANRMPPKTATRLLLAAGTVCATTSLLALTLLASTLIGRLPLVAGVGAWSGDVLHHYTPVPATIAKLAIATLTVLTCCTMWSATRRWRALRRARRTCHELGPSRLVVLNQPEPEAFAVPAGRTEGGRIVVSTGLLRTLNATERRVLLAHETAHLNHRHHRHRTLAALISTANPLLATLPGTIHHLTERWADEDAATTVEDRTTTARTLARAALASHNTHQRSATNGAVLCFGHGSVPRRVRALLTGTPPRRPLAALALVATLVTCLLAAVEAGNDTAGLFDRANDRYHAKPISPTSAIHHEARHLLTIIAHRLTP